MMIYQTNEQCRTTTNDNKPSEDSERKREWSDQRTGRRVYKNRFLREQSMQRGQGKKEAERIEKEALQTLWLRTAAMLPPTAAMSSPTRMRRTIRRIWRCLSRRESIHVEVDVRVATSLGVWGRWKANNRIQSGVVERK